jgi:aspartokinase/homoserine dehydrogenase 1
MKVLKFGGTSIGNPDMILRVKGIIDSLNLPCVIVVSAFGGVTDKLCRISELASSGNNDTRPFLRK